MSRSNVNRIILVGNLGRDPEKRVTPKGNSVVTLSIATNRRRKTPDGNEVEETSWHKATVWGRTADACAQYLIKGSKVYLEGELKMKDWKDKEGNSRRSHEVMVDSIQFLGGTKMPEKNVSAEAVLQ